MKDKIKNLTDFLNELDTQERTGFGRFIEHDVLPDDEESIRED
jgi:hypothetical protein